MDIIFIYMTTVEGPHSRNQELGVGEDGVGVGN